MHSGRKSWKAWKMVEEGKRTWEAVNDDERCKLMEGAR